MTILPNPHSSQHHLSSFLGSILLSAVLCPLSCISFLTLPTIPYTSSDCTCQPPNSRPWLGMSSKVVFDKPVGAYADVAEIEYVSALMQTDRSTLRKDGTLLGKYLEFSAVLNHIVCAYYYVHMYLHTDLVLCSFAYQMSTSSDIWCLDMEFKWILLPSRMLYSMTWRVETLDPVTPTKRTVST